MKVNWTQLCKVTLEKTGPLFKFICIEIHFYILNFNCPSLVRSRLDLFVPVFILIPSGRPIPSLGCAAMQVFAGTPGGGMCPRLEVPGPEMPHSLAGVRVNAIWATPCSLFWVPGASAMNLLNDHKGSNLSVFHGDHNISLHFLRGDLPCEHVQPPAQKITVRGLLLWKGICGGLRNKMTWRLLSPQTDAAWNPCKALPIPSTVWMA